MKISEFKRDNCMEDDLLCVSGTGASCFVKFHCVRHRDLFVILCSATELLLNLVIYFQKYLTFNSL